METSAAETNENFLPATLTPCLVRKLKLGQSCNVNKQLQVISSASNSNLPINATVSDLLQFGSIVMRDLVAGTDSSTAHLSSLKLMIEECFSVTISHYISKIINRCSRHKEELLHVVKSEEVLEDSHSPSEKYSDLDHDDFDVDDVMPGNMSIPSDHNSDTLRKDVTPHILYTRRGARCYHCWFVIKCPNAVDILVQHTKDHHPEKATPENLISLREENSFDKLLGNGFPYCTCEHYKVFEMARFHDGFPKRLSHC